MENNEIITLKLTKSQVDDLCVASFIMGCIASVDGEDDKKWITLRKEIKKQLEKQTKFEIKEGV